jgi:hypothetical protein
LIQLNGVEPFRPASCGGNRLQLLHIPAAIVSVNLVIVTPDKPPDQQLISQLQLLITA